MRIHKNIFRNLRLRFDLDVTPPIELAPSVQLVSQVDPLLEICDIESSNNSAVGLTSFFDVPDDEKWNLKWISADSASSKTHHAYIYVDSSVGPFLIVVPMQTSDQVVSGLLDLDLMPGWGIQVITAAGTTGSNWHSIYVKKEKWTPYVEK